MLRSENFFAKRCKRAVIDAEERLCPISMTQNRHTVFVCGQECLQSLGWDQRRVNTEKEHGSPLCPRKAGVDPAERAFARINVRYMTGFGDLLFGAGDHDVFNPQRAQLSDLKVKQRRAAKRQRSLVPPHAGGQASREYGSGKTTVLLFHQAITRITS